jgi:hypothetical protein
VHIRAEFLKWYKNEYPLLIVLFISANFTGCRSKSITLTLTRLTLTTFRWLQPLDIAFNLVFKRILKETAAKWLAKNMAEQLKMCGGDPSKVKLDIGLKAMKPLFVIWFCDTLKEMMSARNVAHNLKGWDISNMSNAFLSEHHALDSVEYCKAEKMASDGTLFANITGKSKGGDNADAIMLDYFGRLGGNLTLTLIIQPITNPDPDCSVQRARLPLSKCGGSHPCNSTHGL